MAIFQRTLTATAAAATVFAALAMPVWAQAPAATGPAAEPAARTAPAHQPRDRAAHEKRMAEKAQKFQAALQLTEAQQADWNRYREAIKPVRPAKHLDRESFAKLTTPQRIDHMQQRRAERNAQADRRAEATKAFYATLTPAQQKTFDAQTLRHGPHGKRHGPHGHGKHHAPAQAAAPAAAGAAR
ncbi:Spy/CpxP family protein refolding chaperone [Comamonas endophytica]|uniref:Spy/CpxP family protein refolding chaperone n=1 Tax=Comamonas endophytica TaxID=2949090 RepID=A0ABY6GDM6_9BURK|nr:MULTISPECIES: Spy/CpxP family protein refolding chaperone [unclassified Acidovorax]MCD2512440.1 Spy/CpxP family protein refolding chaperone [Acidovorax sp. D4N7]UYG53189.1 Spy/CpxP family protein refolding chaperone [Acidovorax sp. 5MLIR]